MQISPLLWRAQEATLSFNVVIQLTGVRLSRFTLNKRACMPTSRQERTVLPQYLQGSSSMIENILRLARVVKV